MRPQLSPKSRRLGTGIALLTAIVALALAGIARADTGNTTSMSPTVSFPKAAMLMQRLPMRRLRASTGGRRRSCTISPTPMRRKETSVARS